MERTNHRALMLQTNDISNTFAYLLSDSYTHSLVDTQRKKQKNELKIKKAKNNVEAYKLWNGKRMNHDQI